MSKMLLLSLIAVLGAALPRGGEEPATAGRPLVALVTGPGAPAPAPQAVDRLRARAEAAGARFTRRTPTTTADQLGALHLLAAIGARTIHVSGLDARGAVAPVAAAYPGLHFAPVPR